MPTSPTLATRLIGLQAFKEVTFNTSGAATAKMMGIQPLPVFTPKFKSTTFDEQRGTVVPAYNSAILMLGGAFSIKSHVTYEDIIYWLSAAVQGGVTPTGGPSYTWPFVAPVTAYTPWNAQTYSFEYGYDIGAFVASGCVVEKLSLKGESNKQWEADISGWYATHTNYSAINIASSTNASPIEITTAAPHNLVTGQQVVVAGHLINTAANGTWIIVVTGASTFTMTTSVGNGIGAATGTVTRTLTPSLADRTVEIAIVPPASFYLDVAGGTIGTTSFANTLSSFTLDIETGLKPVYTASSLSPISFVYDVYKASLTLNVLYTAAVKAFIQANFFTGLGALVRLKSVSGSKQMQFDFAGVLADDPKMYDSKDAAQVIPLKLDARYDSALANFLKFSIINGVSALP